MLMPAWQWMRWRIQASKIYLVKEQDHNKFMSRCLELGAMAKANGNTAVGSVIVKNDNIIAEGIEGAKDLPDSLAHAEVFAIVNAIKYTGSNNLNDCILYTTVEPCFMCSYLIRQTKIKEVIFGITTPETGGASSEFPFLSATSITKWDPPPVIVEGILKKECENILK